MTGLYADDTDPRYVYLFWSTSGECLYVGCSFDFAARLRWHQREQSWFGEIAAMTVAVYPNAEAGTAAESQAIRTLNPTHNRALTDHDTPRRLPCRSCHTGQHAGCLGVNRDGKPCRCGVCANAKKAAA